ncbi:hypothetical protein D3088_23605 [Escherichia coli]|nr:hypothetical protein [Escherichia coli]EFN9340731.1 hypothetical protein [Escherichia coli]
MVHLLPFTSLSLCSTIPFILAFPQKQQNSPQPLLLLASVRIYPGKWPFTHLVFPAIMRDNQTKGSARCDLFSWKDPDVQVRIPVSINSACAT